MVTQPSGATSGAPFTIQPVVELRDASNQPFAQAGVVITVSEATGPGTLGGTLTGTTDTQGRVAFAGLVIAGVGSHTLLFAAPGLASATSAAFNVATLPATQLVIVAQPSASAVSGVVLVAQPVVELRDASNTPVLQAGVVVTVVKASGTGTLGGTLTATTNAQGRATFTSLVINGVGPHTLSFSAPTVTSASSTPIAVNTPPAIQLMFVTHPAGATSGLAFAVQPVIELRDANDQPVAQAGVAVTAAKASAPAH